MNCKAIILFITLVLVMFFTFTLSVSADDDLNNAIQSELSDEVKEVLESIGFSDISAESIMNISVVDVFRSIAGVFRGSLDVPLKTMAVLLGLMIAVAVIYGVASGNSGIRRYSDSVCSMCIVLVAFSGSITCIDAALDSLYTAGILMKSLIPVVAAFAAFSGNPTVAVSYNSISMYCAQLIVYLCSDIFSPVVCIFSAVSVCTGINDLINAKPLLEGIKKSINVLLGLIGTVYTGILALKDVFAVGIDKVAVKGVKFVIGSAVPVVGSALSEGLSSVIASVSLMRNTYGTIGIIVVTAVTLPAVCELILWSAVFAFSGYGAAALGLNKVSAVLEYIRYSVTIMLSLLLFSVYILIVSSAMIILLTGK